jgi:outer membrane protein assembly factor BamB
MKTLINCLKISVFLLFIGTMTNQAQDWPQWRGVNRDGKVTGFVAPQTWPQQFNQVWKVTVGVGNSGPALVGNRIYVFARQSDNEVLQCFDASTGNKIWQSEGYPAAAITGPAAPHPGPRCSVTVAEGKVITIGVWGDVACFDATSGKLLWRNEDYKGKVPPFGQSMSPLVTSGICYAHLGGPQTGTFVAFDLKTGAIKWKVEGDGPAYGSPVLLTVDGSKHIVFQALTKLVGFDLADGRQLWELATPVGTGRVQNSTSPVADQNKIYYTGLNNGVNAIEIRKEGSTFSVNKLWTNPDFSTGYNTPVLKDGFLYGISAQSKLFCINANNGQTAWRDETIYQTFGSLIDAGNVIIALTSNSMFLVIKPDGQQFTLLASIKIPEKSTYAHPILSGNKIYIEDLDSLTMLTTN